MEVGFCHDALSDEYDKQANEQGFTLGDKAEKFKKVKFAYNMLYLSAYITDPQADKILRKIQKDLVKNLKVLKKEK